MPSCAFKKCKNYGLKISKDKGVTYHAFPSDELTKHKWICTVRTERSERDWMPTKRSTICSAHFKEEDKYTTTKGYIRLKKSAVPVVVSDDILRAASPTSLDNVNISNMESIFDTPRKATLKKRVRKLTSDKKDLQKKNKVLKNQNKRLKEKVTSLKNILKDLKKTNSLTEQQFSEYLLSFNSVRQLEVG